MTVTEKGICWSCRSPLTNYHFCDRCQKIQEDGLGEDYFSFLGLPRSGTLNLKKLDEIFYDLSRKLHPDYFAGASEKEKSISVLKSARLNLAYKTLRDETSRARYLVELFQGSFPSASSVSPDLLREIFDLQEKSEEASDPAQLDSVIRIFTERIQGVREKLAQAFLQIDASMEALPTAPDPQLLAHLATLVQSCHYLESGLNRVQATVAQKEISP